MCHGIHINSMHSSKQPLHAACALGSSSLSHSVIDGVQVQLSLIAQAVISIQQSMMAEQQAHELQEAQKQQRSVHRSQLHNDFGVHDSASVNSAGTLRQSSHSAQQPSRPMPGGPPNDHSSEPTAPPERLRPVILRQSTYRAVPQRATEKACRSRRNSDAHDAASDDGYETANDESDTEESMHCAREQAPPPPQSSKDKMRAELMQYDAIDSTEGCGPELDSAKYGQFVDTIKRLQVICASGSLLAHAMMLTIEAGAVQTCNACINLS